MNTQGGQEHSEAVKSALCAGVLLDTRMSGAGLPTALTIREDTSCQGFDNVPVSLVAALIADERGSAAGADRRSHGVSTKTTLANLAHVLLRSERCVECMDCDDDRRERRYTETRQPHLLAGDRRIIDGICRERQMLPAPRHRADPLIGTSALTAELKRLLMRHFALAAAELRVFVTCFAYRRAAN